MSLFICVPKYGGHSIHAHDTSMMALKADLEVQGFPHMIHTLWNESAVHRARNKCVQEFMWGAGKEYERLFFIDSDIEFSVDDAGRIWNLDADIGVGIYPCKDLKTCKYAAYVEEAQVVDLKKLGKDPIEVKYAGTGFMMIKRQVFQRMWDEFPELRYKDDKGDNMHWFHFPLVGGVELSEDFAFCERWRNMGGKVIADPLVKLVHWGLHGFGSEIKG